MDHGVEHLIVRWDRLRASLAQRRSALSTSLGFRWRNGCELSDAGGTIREPAPNQCSAQLLDVTKWRAHCAQRSASPFAPRRSGRPIRRWMRPIAQTRVRRTRRAWCGPMTTPTCAYNAPTGRLLRGGGGRRPRRRSPRCARGPYLVLSDVMMPRLDGFGLVAALRADPRTHAMPVILLWPAPARRHLGRHGRGRG